MSGLPPSSGFNQFTLGLQADSNAFNASLLRLGLPCALLSAILLALHFGLRLQCGSVKNRLAKTAYFAHPAAAIWMSLAYDVLVAGTIGLWLAWGIVTSITVRPRIIGLGILLLLPAAACALFAFEKGRASGWSCSARHRPVPATLLRDHVPTAQRAAYAVYATLVQTNPVHLLLMLAVALFTGYELCVIYNGNVGVSSDGLSVTYSHSFLGTSWLFMTWNMLCVLLAMHALIHARIDVHDLIAAWLHAKHKDVASVTPAEAAASATLSSFLNVPSKITATAPRRGVLAWYSSLSAGVRTAMGWYIISLAVLATYVGVNVSLSASDVDDGRYVCIAVAVCVLMADGVTACMLTARMFSTPGVAAAVLAGARIALIAYGSRYWILGIATLYTIIACYLAHCTAVRLMAHGDTAAKAVAARMWGRLLASAKQLSAAVGSTAPAASPPSTSSPSPSNAATPVDKSLASHAVQLLQACLFTPAGLLVSLTAAFTVYIAGLSVAMQTQEKYVPHDPIETLQSRVPQYAFGVGGVCAAICVLLSELAFRLYLRGSLSWSGWGWALVAFVWSVYITCGAWLWAVTRSYMLLFSGIWAPPLIILILAMYGQWVRDDFHELLPGGVPAPRFLRNAAHFCVAIVTSLRARLTCSTARSSTVAAATGTTPGSSTVGATPGTAPTASTAQCATAAVVDQRWYSLGVITADQIRNAYMCGGMIAALGCLIAFGACVGVTVSPGYVGWTIAAGIAVLLLTIAPIHQWFATLEATWFQGLSITLAVAFHAGIHGALWRINAYGDRNGYVTIGLAFSFCVYPFIVLLLTALYKWWDDHWRISRFVVVTLTASQCIIVGFAAAGVAVFGDVTIPAALLGAYVAVSFVVCLGVVWVLHDFYMPPLYARIAYTAAATAIAGGIALCVWEYVKNGRADRAVLWLSLAYWTAVVGGMITAFSELHGAGFFSASDDTSLMDDAVDDSSAASAAAVYSPQAPGVVSFSNPAHTPRGVQVAVPDSPAPLRGSVITVQTLPSTSGGAATRSQARLYFSSSLLPVHRFDPATGAIRQSHYGVYLALATAVAACIWGTLAMVFISPSYIGVMVTNIVKLIAALTISQAIHGSHVELVAAVRALEGTAGGSMQTAPTAAAADVEKGLSDADSLAVHAQACVLQAVGDATEAGLRIVGEGASPTVTATIEAPAASAAGAAAMPVATGDADALPAYAYAYDAIFRANSLAARAQCMSDLSDAYLLRWTPPASLIAPCIPRTRASCSAAWTCHAADVPEWRPTSDGASIVYGTVTPSPALPPGAAYPSSASTCVPALCTSRELRRQQLADPTTRAAIITARDVWPDSIMHPTAPACNMSVYVCMLLETLAVYDEARDAAAEEALLCAHVAHSVIRAGTGARAAEAMRWRALLSWLADEATFPVLEAHDLRIMAGYAALMAAARSGSTSTRAPVAIPSWLQAHMSASQLVYLQELAPSVVAARSSLLVHWQATFGLTDADRMSTRLLGVEAAFEDHLAVLSLENDRRRQADAAAAARRAEEARRRAEADAAARLADQQRAAAEAAAATAADAAAAAEKRRQEEQQRKRLADAEAAALQLQEAVARAREENEAARRRADAEAAAHAEADRAAVAARQAMEAAKARAAAEAIAHAKELDEQRRALEKAQADAAARAQQQAEEIAARERAAQQAMRDAEAARAAAAEAQQRADAAREQAARDAAAREAAEQQRRRDEEAARVQAARAQAEADAMRAALEAERQRRAAADAEAAHAEQLRRMEEEHRKRVAEIEAQARANAEAAERARREREIAARRAEEEAAARAAAERAAAEAQRANEAAQARIRAEAQQRAADEAARKRELERAQAEAADRARRQAEENAARARAAEQAQRDAEAARAAADEARRQADAAREQAARDAAARAAAAEQRRRQEEAARAAALQAQQEADRLRAELEAQRAREAAAAAAAAAAATTASASVDDPSRIPPTALLARVQKAIADSKKSGRPFTDPEFAGTPAIGALEDPSSVGPWERVDKFAPDVAVAHDGFHPDDVKQGELGDCWLLSAFSVLASHPDLLDQVLITRERNDAGVYGVRWWKNGAWVDIVVDDTFPTKLNTMYSWKDQKLYRGRANVAEQKYFQPIFVNSKSRREFWMMILEKAYAKYYRSYAAIEGGLVHEALCDFVAGSVGESVTMKSAAAKADIRNGKLWAQLLGFVTSGYLLGAGSPSGSDKDVSAQGIVQGHAYSILQAVEETDMGTTYQLVQLRNPWGSTEWKGTWSDFDKRSWTRRMRNKLEYDPDADTDDGKFWMSFADFTVHFEDIYVCRMFKTVPAGPWYRYTIAGDWKGRTAGGCTNNPDTAQWNPQYYLAPTLKCKVFVQLQQSDTTAAGVVSRRALPAIGLRIVKKGGKRMKVAYAGEVVLSTAYEPQARTYVEGVLTPGAAPFTIFISTFDPGVERSFTVTLYADQKLDPAFTDGDKLRLIPVSVAAE